MCFSLFIRNGDLVFGLCSCSCACVWDRHTDAASERTFEASLRCRLSLTKFIQPVCQNPPPPNPRDTTTTMADDVDFQTPRWQREVVRTETGRLTSALPRNIPALHQLALAAFWPTPPQWETGKWFKEATSPRDNAPCDLILEKQRSPEDNRCLRNPVRWNLSQWRVAHKNIRPTRHGKTAVIHNCGFFGFG